jgi:hypothetical protein
MTEKFFDEDLALAELLKAGVLFSNSRNYSREHDGKSEGHTIVLFVLCNDVFAWACADAEDLPLNEVENLYKLWKAEGHNGATKWCCFRWNEKPQKPVADLMKQDGVWDEKMEALPDNHYDKIMEEKYGKQL